MLEHLGENCSFARGPVDAFGWAGGLFGSAMGGLAVILISGCGFSLLGFVLGMQLGKTSRYLHKAASDYLLSASTKINFMWIELPSNPSFFQTDFLNAIGHGAVCDFCAISPIPSLLSMSPNVSARLAVCTCCHLCVPLLPLSTWMPSPSLLPNWGQWGP